MKTLKFISIEHPLKFYGVIGLIFLGIGLFFTIMTIQGFAETRQILLSTSIILYTLATLIKENPK